MMDVIFGTVAIVGIVAIASIIMLIVHRGKEFHLAAQNGKKKLSFRTDESSDREPRE